MAAACLEKSFSAASRPVVRCLALKIFHVRDSASGSRRI